MTPAGQAQKQVEVSNQNKFNQTKELALGEKKLSQSKPVENKSSNQRISPQISCTIAPEDKQLLQELTLFCSNKAGKILNVSHVIRALIRLGHKRKDELDIV